jgi:inosine-uridine nucleoside N-ribohydrolase
MVGGVWREPGDAGPVVEFHCACDPAAARQVLHCGVPLTLVPLDVTRKIVFSPSDLLQLPAEHSPACAMLRRIVPHGIRATSSLYGIEGFYLQDVLGLLALTQPPLVQTKPAVCDVETRGELTRGMTVLDNRWGTTAKPNIDLATGVDVQAVRRYIDRILYHNE